MSEKIGRQVANGERAICVKVVGLDLETSFDALLLANAVSGEQTAKAVTPVFVCLIKNVIICLLVNVVESKKTILPSITRIWVQRQALLVSGNCLSMGRQRRQIAKGMKCQQFHTMRCCLFELQVSVEQ